MSAHHEIDYRRGNRRLSFAVTKNYSTIYSELQKPHVIDPSELLRPEPDFTEKGVSKFRDYTIDESDPLKEMVRKTYRLMHLNQTVDFVKRKCPQMKCASFVVKSVARFTSTWDKFPEITDQLLCLRLSINSTTDDNRHCGSYQINRSCSIL